MANKALKARLVGRVLGVNFRSKMHRSATRLGLTGYVKALPNRTLEVLAEGDEKDLETFLSYIAEGPERAEIEEFEVNWMDYEGHDNRFTIKYEGE